jgi:hypothetical protein
MNNNNTPPLLPPFYQSYQNGNGVAFPGEIERIDIQELHHPQRCVPWMTGAIMALGLLYWGYVVVGGRSLLSSLSSNPNDQAQLQGATIMMPPPAPLPPVLLQDE